MKKISPIIILATVLLSLFMYPETHSSARDLFKDAYMILRLSNFTGEDIQDTDDEYADTHVVFMFDDGWESVYINAYPLLKKYGYKGSIAVIPKKVGEYEYMSYIQLAELYMDGWDMLNHTYAHKENMYTKCENMLAECMNARTWLQNHQLTKCKNMVVTAYGECNPYLIKLLNDSGFTSIRTSDNILNLNREIEYIPAITIHMLNDISVDAIKAKLLKSSANYDVILLNLHKINNIDDETQMSFSPEKLELITEFLYKNQDKFRVVPYSYLFD